MKINFITIIYNPKSSGESSLEAQELYGQIRQTLPEVGVEVVATKYAGHAADVAEITCRTRVDSIIVAVGGDGTYNEIVNGIMRVPSRQRSVSLVVPAGNANDHATMLGTEKQVIERLVGGITQPLDIIKVSVHNPVGEDILRFAHSYVGFGSSGRVARWIDDHRVGRVAEKIAVVRELVRPQQFEIVADGRMKYLFSLVCGNIGHMAKYMTLGKKADPSDGKIEVVETPAVSRMRLLREVAGSVAGSGPKPKKVARYSFMLMSGVQAQFDGEPLWLPRGATVTVTVQPKAIRTLV
jgi:diacylglycerol kinase (ATP)